ncbi:putative 39S ribosomal protein L51, mitochondrial [Hypsibius exemplaris]|uniref:Large ribosomal subunit protein mL51 n=2 Tax=Hypsibius TaxID=58670 RepID=A0A1W0X0W5_HYPEX|nr:putative mitochondrial 39S ribosomal protein L51 [Hypsibius dujardini]OQV21137.1 putative 39S ribosomal protein L51, mitochondrial [Hypsibius exemplaris]
MAFAGWQCASILARPLIELRQPSPMVQAVRWWRERPVYTRRMGFEINHHIAGPLPRLDAVTPETKPIPQKPYRPTNNWSAKKATFGQNDYIDILGDGTLHPRDMLHEGPHWLRGFKGNEFRRLLRRRNATFHYAPYIHPTKWNTVMKRLKYLYEYHNFKQNHKDWRNME